MNKRDWITFPHMADITEWLFNLACAVDVPMQELWMDFLDQAGEACPMGWTDEITVKIGVD